MSAPREVVTIRNQVGQVCTMTFGPSEKDQAAKATLERLIMRGEIERWDVDNDLHGGAA